MAKYFKKWTLAPRLKNRGKADDIRIDLSRPHVVAIWTIELRVSEEQLATAVQKVGPIAKDVRKYFKK